MQTNAFPKMDISENPTGCCPRFKPEGWDNQHLHFEDKTFLRATTRSAMHIPWNMGQVFTRVQEHIEDAAAVDPADEVVLSRDLSAWEAEHFFAVDKSVPDEDTTLSARTISLNQYNEVMRTQFAADLRLARRKAGYLQTDIAVLLSAHQSVVSGFESGKLRPDLEQIIALSLIYGRSFEAFFAEMMEECREQLRQRLKQVPTEIQETTHTFNRAGSLKQLHQRLTNPIPYGSA